MASVELQGIKAQVAPVSSYPATVAAAPVAQPAAPVVAADGTETRARSISAERTKLSGLQAPAAGVSVRGSSRVADGSDVLWGALMGALWADGLSR